MSLDEETLRQLRHILRPHATRLANMIARGVVQLVNDGKKMQLVQIGALANETVEGDKGAEHFQAYGFSSVPLVGAEHVTIFPTGDRGHPLVIVVADRRYRPTGREPGEVTVYNHTGASMTITKDGDIVARPAAGRQMLVDDGSGAAALPTMADFNGIISIMNAAGVGSATNLPLAVTNYQAAHPTWPDGTTVLKGK